MPEPSPTPGGQQRTVTLLSYRAIFDLEYRIHRVPGAEHIRLPFANGVALSAVVWSLAAIVAIVIAGAIPGLSVLIGLLPPPIHYVMLPVGVGVLLARYRPDGRPAHAFLAAVVRHACATKEIDAFAPTPAVGSEFRFAQDICFLPDTTGSAYRPGTLTGPARVLLRYQAGAQADGDTLELTQTSTVAQWQAKELTLRPGQRLVIHPAPALSQEPSL